MTVPDQEAEPATQVEIKPSEELVSFHENPTLARLEPEQQQPPTEETELQGKSQTFYPSYTFNNPPHGHSRPFFFQQEGAYSQRAGSFRQNLAFEPSKYENFQRQRDTFAASTDTNQGLLGSGNFGVIRGGTFYNDQDDISEFAATRHNIYSNAQYYNNGHGGPSSYYLGGNPRPYQHEQFANFKDFADINTPSYSQFVLVYVNKNQAHAKEEKQKGPKNIMETLAKIDEETTKPAKKLSKFKRKLALLPSEKKVRIKSVTEKSDLYEPLLALS